MSEKELLSLLQVWNTLLELHSINLPPGLIEYGDRASLSSETTRNPNSGSNKGNTSSRLPQQNTASSGIPSASQRFWQHGRSGAPPAPMPDMSFLSRRTTKELPVIINKSIISARHDSGAEGNFMTLEMATNLNLSVHQKEQDCEQFTLGDGRVIGSVGRVKTTLAFAKEPTNHIKCCFHILNTLSTPLILGAPFLEETKTLSLYQSRLRESQRKVHTLPVVNSIGSIKQSKRLLMCHIDDKQSFAHADSGSDLDLVSLSFVKARNYKIWTGIRQIQLADRSIAQTMGKVLVTLRLADNRQFLKFFDILPGLTSDVLLGQDTLEDIEAFTSLKDSFVEVPVGTSQAELNIIFDLGPIAKFFARFDKREISSPSTTKPPSTDSMVKQQNNALHTELLRKDAAATRNSTDTINAPEVE